MILILHNDVLASCEGGGRSFWKNIAYVCPACGDAWGRIIINEGDWWSPPGWCPKHHGEFSGFVAGSFAQYITWNKPARETWFRLLTLPGMEAAVEWEFARMMAYVGAPI